MFVVAVMLFSYGCLLAKRFVRKGVPYEYRPMVSKSADIYLISLYGCIVTLIIKAIDWWHSFCLEVKREYYQNCFIYC